MDKKIIRNFMYNVSYQILILILPFITIPYISRIFSPDIIGVYSSTYANSQIFCIIALFAIGSYGSKEIAVFRDNKALMSKRFYEIRKLQVFSTTVALIIYLVSCVIFFREDSLAISIVQSINVIAVFFDISWLFMGIEDFKKTVFRNTMVKIVSLVMIFLIVKTKDDLVIYTLIISLSNLFGNVSMWVYKNRVVYKRKKVKMKNFKKHIINAGILLIPQICFQIYTGYDRNVLSIVSTSEQVGLYDQSQKLIRISISVITSLSLVMLPRMSNIINNSFDKEKINKLLKESMSITSFLAIGCSFGLFAISNNFVPWFFGTTYLDVIELLKMTSIVGVFTSIGGVLTNQFAIPANRKKACVIPVFIAAIISIIFNLILGSVYGAVGACVTIILAEAISFVLKLFYLRKELNYSILFSDFLSYLLAGICMVASIVFLDNIFDLNPGIVSTILEIIVGGTMYMISSMLLNKKLREQVIRIIYKIPISRKKIRELWREK